MPHHHRAHTKPVNYRNISLALLAIVFIQATAIVQLYFVSSSCQQSTTDAAAAAAGDSAGAGDGASSLSGDSHNLKGSITTTDEKTEVVKKATCGTLNNIPIGEENALSFGLSSDVTANLVYPTTGLTLSGDMITDGPVSAFAFRHIGESYGHTFDPVTLAAATVDADEWIIATVNREYIKMLHIMIKKDVHNVLVVYAVAAGYVNVHSLHSFGSSYNIQDIQASDLTSAIVKHAWKRRVEQETHGYQLNTLNYCVCNAVDATLPLSKFDSVAVPVATNDAHDVIVTDSHTLLGGSQITDGPVKCKVFRSTNIAPTAEKALWLLAAVNGDYIKIVEVTVSQAEVKTSQSQSTGSLSVFASNSGYTAYKEFGTYETDALTSRVVNAAWNKMIPNTYDVSGFSYYSQSDEDLGQLSTV
jgi:hypothetical protein